MTARSINPIRAELTAAAKRSKAGQPHRTARGQASRRAARLSLGAALLTTSAIVPLHAQTFDIGGGPLVVGDFQGPPLNGATVITNGQLTIDTAADLPDYAGILNDSFGVLSLAKSGTGSVILSGANSYTGGTTITGGTLIARNASALGSGQITLNGSGAKLVADFDGTIPNRLVLTNETTLAAASGRTFTVSAVLRLDPGLIRFGSATETGTIVLNFQDTVSASNSARYAIEGGTLRLGSDFSAIIFASFVGVQGLTINSAGTLDLAGFAITARRFSGTGTILNSGAATTLTFADSTFAGTLDTGANGITLAGSMEGLGGLTKRGTGTLTLASGLATSAFTGGLTLAEGTLALRGNLASTFGTIRTTGSVIDFGDGITSAAPIAIDSGTTQLQVLTGSATQSGVISELNGPRGFEKIGAGNLALTAANTFTGVTRISEGTLTLGADDVLPDASALAIAGGTLALGTFRDRVASVNLSSGSITGGVGSALGVNGQYLQSGGTLAAGASVNVAAGGTIRLSGGTIAGTLNGLGTAADGAIVEGAPALVTGALDIAGPLRIGNTGTGTLTVSGGGTMTTQRDTFLGFEAGSRGTLDVAGAGTTWDAAGLTIGRRGTGSLVISDGASVTNGFAGIGGFATGVGTIEVTGTGTTFTNTGEIAIGSSGNGTLVINDGALVQNTNANIALFGNSIGSATVAGAGSRWENAGALQVGRLADGTLEVLGGGTVTSATGTIGSAVSLIGPPARGTGTVTVRGAGSAWINTGFLRIGDNGTGVLTLAEGAAVTTDSIAIARQLGSIGTLVFGAAEGSAAVAAGTLTTPTIAFGAGTGTAVFNHTSSDFGLAAAISGNGTLRQIAGTTTLSGASGDFTGTTSVTGGRLLVNGTLGGAVTVSGGGTLGGTGTLAGSVTIGSGGVLSPGLSPGTMTVGALTLEAGSTSVFELAQAGVAGGPNNDLIRVTGNLALNGGTIQVVRGAGFGTGQYTLFAFDSLSGALGNMALDPLGAGFIGNLALGDGTVLLNAASSGELVWWNGTTTSPTGAIVGGSGTWSRDGGNFTDAAGAISGTWPGDGSLAVFGGTAGTVTIAPGAMLAPSGLNFVTDGYVITGGDAASGLLLAGPTGIDTAAGVGATIAADISGAGSLTKTGGGALTLTGANTYAGATNVLGGTLVNSGTIAGDVLSAATFRNGGSVAGNVTADVGGTIDNLASGQLGGRANVNAGGTLNNAGVIGGLAGNSGTLTSSGTLGGGLVNSGSAQIAGTLTGDVANSGRITLTGATGGIGAVSQTAGGIFDLAGNSAMIGSLAGAGSVLLGAATLTTGGSNAATSFAGAIAGSGGLTKTGTGTFTLTGTNTYTGTTTIAGGALQLGDGGTAGAIGGGAIVNNGALVINRSNAVTLGNTVSGSGRLVQDGTGTTTLTGANSYSGGTQVNRGRLVGTTASLQGAIVNNAALEFAMATGGTFAGSLSGSGLVEKTGAGVLTFAGNGSGLTGPFAVLGGGLRLDGANGGRLDRAVVTLASGTRLTGSGLVGGLVVQSGAVVAPGNSLGTIGVAGDVTFMAGSRLVSEVSDLGADLIAASGTARLAGALDIVNITPTASYNFNRTFSLITAEGGLSGSFDAVSISGFSPIFRPTLRSGPRGLELVLAPNSLAALGGSGLAGNQAAVAARLDAAVAAGFNPQAFLDIYNLAPAPLAAALDQLAGEVHPAMGRAAMRQSRLPREAVLERAAGVARADSPSGDSWGGWGKLMRSWGEVTGEGASRSGAAAQATDTEGFVIGFDGGTANDARALRFGIYGSYLNTRIAIDGRGSSGQIEQAGGGVYASLAAGGFSLVAGGGAARFDVLTNRTVALPGLAGATSTASAGDMAQLFGRVGYRFDLGAASLEPYAAADAAWIALDQTTERGGAAALAVGRQEYRVAGASAGVAARLPLGNLRLESDLAARFELGDRAPQALIALAAAPGQATRIASTRLAGTAFTGRLGAVLPIARRIEVRVDYAGEFSATDTEHTAQAGISIAF